MSDLLSSLQIGSGRRRIAGLIAVGVAVIVVAGIVFPDSIAGILLSIVTSKSALSSTLRLSVPIAFAALGGIFAEKSGIINIGIEGHLIIAAFVAIYGTNLTGSIWLGFVAGVLASTLLAGLFAVICIEFRADQIIAGLAVWLVALGLAPFLSTVIYGSVNVDGSGSFGRFTIPVLSEIPFFGALFSATFPVYLLFIAVALSWYVLNRTSFGRWVNASGENPEALATVGVSVRRVRYVSVLLSGVLAGMGGASFSIGLSQFVGNGQTMIGGRGFIAIVAYLFGNYNPVGAFFSTTLFAGLQALQIRLQSVPGYAVPDSLIQTIPYITVIVVLAFVGRTRIPSAAGEHYDSGED
ncbi:ABC transporter permease [Halocatena marina]|uniref:ABC transporter permease n=1 Tax=Halocatena marina TaxID=2934937 RepID=UPI00200D69C6|nr:ABC transporter permease [Halocatena marina]